MKQIVVAMLLASMLSLLIPVRAGAYENGVQEVLTDGFYGGLAGTLIGAAFLAFRDKPSDHLKDLRVGAGAGVILGTLYGLGKVTGAIAEVKNGAVVWHMPALKLQADSAGKGILGSVDLLHVPF